ncbi:MAG TPA: MerR family transcriptional regulator [Candidatus Limnocylindrales bacterium]
MKSEPTDAATSDGGGVLPGFFRIADAADHVGVSPSALRLWERQGLIAPSRSRGRYRLYSAGDLARLRTIRRLRQVEGLNAPAIRRVLAQDGDGVPAGVDPRSVSLAVRPATAPQQRNPTPLGVAGRLRRLRGQRGLSLRSVGERTGLSASFISSVERGLTGASLDALRRLTRAYDTTLGELLRDPGLEGGRLVREGERHVLEAGNGVRIEDLARTPTQLEPQLFVLAPGASSEGYYAHQGEEFMYVLSGSVAVSLDDAEHYELAPGDALTFPSTVAHRFEALGPTETRLLWINTPPTF